MFGQKYIDTEIYDNMVIHEERAQLKQSKHISLC